MSDQIKSLINQLARAANILAMTVMVIATIAIALTTILAVAGALPWLELQVAFGGVAYENAGQIAQIGLTVLLLLLCVYLPSAQRVLRLETSHRRFTMGMQDVTQAYAIAHASDRAGLFQAASEYDAVRERMVHLRDHPDLQGLEPEILEVAAQMSRVSQDLAETYSDEKVDRARAFLRERQHEVEEFNGRIDHAKQITAELKNWKTAVEADEAMAASQLERLTETLYDILPELRQPDGASAKGRVVSLPRLAAE